MQRYTTYLNRRLPALGYSNCAALVWEDNQPDKPYQVGYDGSIVLSKYTATFEQDLASSHLTVEVWWHIVYQLVALGHQASGAAADDLIRIIDAVYTAPSVQVQPPVATRGLKDLAKATETWPQLDCLDTPGAPVEKPPAEPAVDGLALTAEEFDRRMRQKRHAALDAWLRGH